MEAELKKVKISRFMSEDSTAYTAQLWVDGEFVADVGDDGHGGGSYIRNRYIRFENGLVPATAYYKGAVNPSAGAVNPSAVEEFRAWCKKLPPLQTEDDPLEMDANFYVGLMLEAYQETQRLKRWCKKGMVIKLPGDKSGQFSTYKQPYSPEFAAQLKREFKEVEIVNERFV